MLFVAFDTFVKEFGYYFDGDSENVKWGFYPTDPNADAKKKAGEKARCFDINADTSTLSGGDHTITYVIKFLNNNTCELTTLNLNINGEGGGNGSGTGEIGGGCEGAVAVGAFFPIALFAGVVLTRKRKEY